MEDMAKRNPIEILFSGGDKLVGTFAKDGEAGIIITEASRPKNIGETVETIKEANFSKPCYDIRFKNSASVEVVLEKLAMVYSYLKVREEKKES